MSDRCEGVRHRSHGRLKTGYCAIAKRSPGHANDDIGWQQLIERWVHGR